MIIKVRVFRWQDYFLNKYYYYVICQIFSDDRGRRIIRKSTTACLPPTVPCRMCRWLAGGQRGGFGVLPGIGTSCLPHLRMQLAVPLLSTQWTPGIRQRPTLTLLLSNNSWNFPHFLRPEHPLKKVKRWIRSTLMYVWFDLWLKSWKKQVWVEGLSQGHAKITVRRQEGGGASDDMSSNAGSASCF